MTTVDPTAQQFHPMNEQPKDNGATPRSVDWNNPRVAAILDAAAKCFARKGFSATTLAEIGKELGLRKSIVHYYFASKAALIHEVQSYTYQKYLDRVKEAIQAAGSSGDPAHVAMRALWAAVGEGDVGLNIEVWSASRNDEELRRRAQALQEEKRKVIEDGLRALLGAGDERAERIGSFGVCRGARRAGAEVVRDVPGSARRWRQAAQHALDLHAAAVRVRRHAELIELG
jgi:AcrR family transcriptional regulator